MKTLKNLVMLYLILAAAIQAYIFVAWAMHAMGITPGVGVGVALGLMSFTLVAVAWLLKLLELDIEIPFVVKL